MLFHNGLTLMFLLLILYHFFSMTDLNIVGLNDTIEGLDTTAAVPNSAVTYTEPPGQTDPAYIARVNSSNISFLKSQIDGIQILKQQMLETNNNVKKNTADISELQTGLKELGKSMGTGLNNKMEDATGINPDSKTPLPSVI
jgi:hypothetical protein